MTDTKPQLGLVVGKFYPFHNGHRHLVDTALRGCQKLVLMVCRQGWEDIDAELRAQWIREVYANEPRLEVRVLDQQALGLGDGDDDKNWARETIRLLGQAPDVVFTSEDYGKPWADSMGAEHVLVDQERNTIPISGTEVRANPLQNLRFLPRVVQEHYLRSQVHHA